MDRPERRLAECSPTGRGGSQPPLFGPDKALAARRALPAWRRDLFFHALDRTAWRGGWALTGVLGPVRPPLRASGSCQPGSSQALTARAGRHRSATGRRRHRGAGQAMNRGWGAPAQSTASGPAKSSTDVGPVRSRVGFHAKAVDSRRKSGRPSRLASGVQRRDGQESRRSAGLSAQGRCATNGGEERGSRQVAASGPAPSSPWRR